jgi:hypothetical protein
MEKINTDTFDRVTVWGAPKEPRPNLMVLAAINTEVILTMADPIAYVRSVMLDAADEWVEIQRNTGKLP